LTFTSFYSGPLRGIFTILKRRDILVHVQTLILDGLSVTAELCSEIINDPKYSVRVLSIRDVKNLNQGKLRGALQYACRASRPEGTPRLRSLYVFGSRVPSGPPASAPSLGPRRTISASWNERSQRHLTSSLQQESELWWDKKGRVIGKHVDPEWALCLMTCEGLIAFDAVLCRGPRHRNSDAPSPLPDCLDPCVATFAVPLCQNCHAAPEGVLTSKSPRFSLPLLSPPPLLSSTLAAAVSPHSPNQSFIARCGDCLRDRYCGSCHSWWCEDCYGAQTIRNAAASHGASAGRTDTSQAAQPRQKVGRGSYCTCDTETIERP
jgi:hypothetical protein